MPHAGRFATVDGALALRKWSVGETSEVKAIIHAGLEGSVVRSQGFTDWSGSWEEWGGLPVVLPGEAFDFIGFMGYGEDDDDDPLPGTGYGWSGPARVDEVEITFNATSGSDPVAHKVSFGANGVATLGAISPPAAPGTVLIPYGPCGLQIKKVLSGGDVVWTDWTTAVLTLSRPSTEFSNASTNCAIQRRGGSAIDVMVKLTDQQMERQANVGDLIELKIYDNVTTFWHVQWLRVLSVGNLEVNRETGDVISHTYDLGFSGFNASGTKGKILMPDTTVVW